jgi:hypothetical protein
MYRSAIRPIGGSLYIKLPPDYRHRYHLGAGDLYDLIPNADGSIIKLVKVDEEKPTASNAAVEQKAEVAAE